MDLGVDRPVPAVVALDPHRGHPDPPAATTPPPPPRAARRLAGTPPLFPRCPARARDYAVVVIEDCVDTMDAPALHEAALTCIRTAFGMVMRSDEIHKLQGLKK